MGNSEIVVQNYPVAELLNLSSSVSSSQAAFSIPCLPSNVLQEEASSCFTESSDPLISVFSLGVTALGARSHTMSGRSRKEPGKEGTSQLFLLC